jgi:hypothetical protein
MRREIVLNYTKISYKYSIGYCDKVLMILLGRKCPGVFAFSNSKSDDASMPCGGDGSSEDSLSWPQV